MSRGGRHCRTRTIALLLSVLLVCGQAGAAPLAGRDPADDIFYMYMPIAWRDSDGDAYRFGDFAGMTAGLDYLRDLGVTAVWMTPVFESPAYHGYQHMPPDRTNPWFGTEAQFLDFVQAAHTDSIKVFLDLVAYGVSTRSVFFQQSYRNPSSSYTDYLAYYDPHTGNSSYDGFSFPTWNGDTVGFVRWNNAYPALTDSLVGWTRHWLDPDGDGDPADGIDGYRLDHVLLDEGWGYTIGWWEGWNLAMRQVNPSVFLFAEQADWSSHGAELLSAHDAVFTKPFEFAARDAIARESAVPLYTEMAATYASLPPGKLYLCTLGNHDVNRLMSDLGDDWGRAQVAAAVLMTQPFPPIVYFGDELGMRGRKTTWPGDTRDIPMREPFKWSAVAGPPMTNYHALNDQAYANRTARDHDGRSVEEQQGVQGSLLETYRSLIRTRRDHVALRRGTYTEIPNSSPAVWAFARHAAAETLLVAINLSASDTVIRLDLANFEVTGGSSTVRDVLSGATLADLTTANQSAYPLDVAGHGWRILRAGVTPRTTPATTLDGRNIPADFGPGALVATQNAATRLGDNVDELDQMFVQPEAAGLRIGITGNLDTHATALALLFDDGTGGQERLETGFYTEPPSGVPRIDGMVMDAGFRPTLLLWANGWAGTLYVDLFDLASGGRRYVGSSIMNGGAPQLSGGSNPNGMQATFDDRNALGVTATDASGAATATSGFEAILPWADLGMSGPGGTLEIMAMMVLPDGFVGNQLLPGLGAGSANLGYVPIDLGTIPGNQYAALTITPVQVANLSALSTRAGIQLRWELSREALRELQGVEVQRARAKVGPWETLTVPPLAPGFSMEFVDPDVLPGQRYSYRLVLHPMRGERVIAGPVTVTVTEQSRGRTGLDAPVASADGASIEIRYRIGRPRTPVRLQIFDITGRLVRSLDQGRRDPGEYLGLWNRHDEHGARAVRGVYIVRLVAGDIEASRKLVLAHD